MRIVTSRYLQDVKCNIWVASRNWLSNKKIWWAATVVRYLRSAGFEVAKDVSAYGWPVLSMAKNSRIAIGARTVLCSESNFTALGVNHPVVLRTLSEGAEIVIGEDTGISGATICAASSIRIGQNCLIGANVMIVDTDFHSINPQNRRYNKNQAEIATAPVNVGSNVFLGAGVIVLKGVTIGDNSVVGAGSVVVHDIPASVVAAGNPAKLLKTWQQAPSNLVTINAL